MELSRQTRILGGALSLSIHGLLLAMATLFALDQIAPRTYPLSAGEILEPMTAWSPPGR